jgi:hypothetical protein
MECFVAYEIICMSLKDSVLNIEFYKKKYPAFQFDINKCGKSLLKHHNFIK